MAGNLSLRPVYEAIERIEQQIREIRVSPHRQMAKEALLASLAEMRARCRQLCVPAASATEEGGPGPSFDPSGSLRD